MPYTDSESATATLTIQGVWIHDAEEILSPAHFPYGENSRETSLDAMGTGAYYAGRVHPVFDYGEHEAESVGVSIDVPHGSTYRADLLRLQAFALAKRPLWIRDNRGRAVYGVMTGFRSSDEAWGSTVSFNIHRSHRDMTEVVA